MKALWPFHVAPFGLFFLLSLVPFLGLQALPSAEQEGTFPSDRDGLEFFEKRIRPVLVERCYECHSAQAKKLKGRLSLESRQSTLRGGESGPALIPGDPEKSLLIRALRYADAELQMPPAGKGKLPPDLIADFERWIKMGAPDPRTGTLLNLTETSPARSLTHWAFLPVRDPGVPRIEPGEQPKNAIDAFLLFKLKEKGLSPVPAADKRTLLRRATLDLIGLPPTPEEIDAFLADASPDAFDKVVERLLGSPRYGERWGRHWLDVARYADTGGYETDLYYKNAWRYRDYVVQSFNDDKPYTVFLQEQVAGDELWPDNLALDGSYEIPAAKRRHLEARIGTGFYSLGPEIHESNMDARKRQHERLTDWVDATGAAFMAMTLGCARCHDHKFDPFTQKDYYSLQAAFAGSREVETPLVSAMGIADQKQVYPKLLAVVEARRAYQLFEKSVAGRALSPQEGLERDRLKRTIADAVLALPQTDAQGSPYDALLDIPTATVLAHEDAALIPVVHRLSRGELARPMEPMGPARPGALARATGAPAELPGPFGSRKELALWLTAENHPLTARVIVNRVWQWHFGRGIVATPNDFGKMGQPPSHPELLDWLARRFMEHGWSIKYLHRLILSSAAYQRSSCGGTAAEKTTDPENRLLWKMNRRRLEGEAVWDALHAVSGTINLKLGGPPVMPPLGSGELTKNAQWVPTADPQEHTRRGIYILVRRNFKFPLFELFDSPGNAFSFPVRDVSTVPVQALWLLNNPTAQAQARAFAARLVRESPDRPEGWIRRAWPLALGRPPSAEELREAAESLGSQAGGGRAALVDLCLALFNLNEFLFVD